jgi:vacuolar-type H+-ATPase subunit F/Vma7
MIGIIGHQDEVIGFGLAGVGKKIELLKSATKEEIKQAIRTMAEQTGAILISESIYEQVRHSKDLPQVIMITIPENQQQANMDAVEQLIKETLGINI